jgi:SagB-type dehydrogenase family enzyme
MAPIIDTLLLLALPASGKSELRRYLAHLDPVASATDFGLGPTVQIDDYPYVHFMRRVSQELRGRGQDPIFFASDTATWAEPRDWSTLIHLLNEDYADLHRRFAASAGSAAEWLFDRFDAARIAAGAGPAFGSLPADVRADVAAVLEPEAGAIIAAKAGATRPEGSTVVIEFARGGPDGAASPLAAPHGYRYSLEQLSAEILSRAAILYVWVTPEESRRKNEERSRPGPEGDASILHHGVPESVMRSEYGTDDMAWLIEHSARPGTVEVRAHGDRFFLPVARFDNRVDQTSFLRAEPEEWDPAAVATLHEHLRRAFAAIQPEEESPMTRDLIDLPAPRFDGPLSVEAALERRRSIRSYAPEPLTTDEVSQLLWSLQGITSDDGMRATPSAGATFPLEIDVATADGVYRYVPQGHHWYQRIDADVRDELARICLDQDCVRTAPAVFIITTVLARIAAKYEDRAERYADFEAGHAAQNLALQAEALGLAGLPVGAFDDDDAGRLLAIADGEAVRYIVPIGRPV